MDSRRDDESHSELKRWRGIVYGIVPTLHQRMTVRAMVFMLIVLVLGIVFVPVLVTNNPGVSLVPGIVIAAVFFIALIVYQSRRSADHDDLQSRLGNFSMPGESESIRLTRILLLLEYKAPPLRWNSSEGWSWDSFSNSCMQQDLCVPSLMASETHREVLEAIPLNEELLEPETILYSKPERLGLSVVSVVASLYLISVAVWMGNWLLAAMWLLVVGSVVIGNPYFRDLFPMLRADGKAPVAGMGYIQDAKNRLWTIDDSILLLSGLSKKDHSIIAYFIGPAGWLMFTYADVEDPEFVKLWQRWNHPEPRPELRPEASIRPA